MANAENLFQSYGTSANNDSLYPINDIYFENFPFWNCSEESMAVNDKKFTGCDHGKPKPLKLVLCTFWYSKKLKIM